MKRLAGPVLWIEAAGALIFGLSFVLAPATMFEAATDATLQSPSAMIDVRATYGGAGIAIAILLGWFTRTGRLRPGLLASIVIWGSIAFARIVGFVIDGSANTIMSVNLAVELVGVIAGLLLLRSLDDGTEVSDDS